MGKIKLIWDFRGADSGQMAEHHARHLDGFWKKHDLTGAETGIDRVSEKLCSAWIAVDESQMVMVRDALKPHRGEKWTPSPGN